MPRIVDAPSLESALQTSSSPPVTNRQNQSALLSQRDKVHRRHQLTLGMVPARSAKKAGRRSCASQAPSPAGSRAQTRDAPVPGGDPGCAAIGPGCFWPRAAVAMCPLKLPAQFGAGDQLAGRHFGKALKHAQLIQRHAAPSVATEYRQGSQNLAIRRAHRSTGEGNNLQPAQSPLRPPSN